MQHRLGQAHALPEALGQLADQLAGDVAQAAAPADLLDAPLALVRAPCPAPRRTNSQELDARSCRGRWACPRAGSRCACAPPATARRRPGRPPGRCRPVGARKQVRIFMVVDLPGPVGAQETQHLTLADVERDAGPPRGPDRSPWSGSRPGSSPLTSGPRGLTGSGNRPGRRDIPGAWAWTGPGCGASRRDLAALSSRAGPRSQRDHRDSGPSVRVPAMSSARQSRVRSTRSLRQRGFCRVPQSTSVGPVHPVGQQLSELAPEQVRIGWCSQWALHVGGVPAQPVRRAGVAVVGAAGRAAAGRIAGLAGFDHAVAAGRLAVPVLLERAPHRAAAVAAPADGDRLVARSCGCSRTPARA